MAIWRVVHSQFEARMQARLRMIKLPLFCGFLVAATFASPALGWESDVHFGLTLFLAQKSGFDMKDEAAVIAAANQGQDETDRAAIGAVFSSACMPWAKDSELSNRVRLDHFPEPAVAPNKPENRVVKPRSKTAVDQVSSVDPAEFADPLKRKGGLQKLGRAIHSLQDSWSHQGVPDVPGFLILGCDEGLAWGHPQNRGGWREHFADLTHMDGLVLGLTDKWPNYDGTDRYLFSCGKTCKWQKDATREMAWATLQSLVEYFIRGSNPGKKVDQGEIDARTKTIWAGIEKDIIVNFQKAGTIKAKRDWFSGQKIYDVHFLDSIDLPDYQEPPPPVERKSRADNAPFLLRRVALDYKGVKAIPDNLEKFLGDFVALWSESRSIGDLEERIGSQFIEPVPFAQSVCGRGNNEIPMDIRFRIAKFLAIWRYSNHGYSAHHNLNHGRLDLCGRASLEILPVIQEDLRTKQARVTHMSLASADEKGLEGNEFVAQVRFEHAPVDTILLLVEKRSDDKYPENRRWKIVAFSWGIEH